MRPHDQHASVLRGFVCAGIHLAAMMLPGPYLQVAGAQSRTAEAGGEKLFLTVKINGRYIGKVGEFNLLRDLVTALPDELREIGLRVPASRPHGSTSPMPLTDLPGIAWKVDRANQEIDIEAPDDRLQPAVVDAFGPGERSMPYPIESGTGLTLNYDLLASDSNVARSGAGVFDGRAFSPLGVVSSGTIVRGGTSLLGSGAAGAIRLDSTYSYADVRSLRRYSVGDFISGGLSWTRPVRLGGVQLRSDFSVRPDLITFPLPTLSGSVAVPSTLSVFANGSLLLSNTLDAGPFTVPQLPVVSGAGTISMTTTDALGRQVSLNQTFYASSSLLAPGLQTVSVQAGLVRLGWGARSNDYGAFAASGTYRRGLTSTLTLEANAETASNTAAGGAGAVWRVRDWGVLNLSMAASGGNRPSGGQIAVGAQRLGKVFSLGASATWANGGYSDLAALSGDPFPRRQIDAHGGVSMRRFGSAGAAFAQQDRGAAYDPKTLEITPARGTKVFSANYSVQVRRAAFYATAFRSVVGGSSGGVQFGMTIPLHRNQSLAMSVSATGERQVQAQKPVLQAGDWGYQVFESASGAEHAFGEVQYRTSAGIVTAGLDRDGDTTTVKVQMRGALSFADRALFASNTIYDSFAIVDTNRQAHVAVLLENREVGRTGASGRLLVPDLRSYDRNRIAIQPLDLPLDATVDDVSRTVRPQDRSGAILRFAVRVSHGALLRLRDEAGDPISVGSTARLRSEQGLYPVGYDGETYVQNLAPHNVLDVIRPDGGRCTATVAYLPAAGEIPVLGPLVCRAVRP